MTSQFTNVNKVKLHYLEEGKGEAILMLHGFPTSGYLWRNVMPELSKDYRVIAMDLPGFGQSGKSHDLSYSFNFYDKIIDGFLNELDIAKVTLVLHDLGGPLGLLWAVRHQEKLEKLVLLNTLVYADFSWGVKLFMLGTRLPFVKSWLSSPKGIAWAMRFGVEQKEKLTPEVIQNYQAPFKSSADQKALLKTVSNLSLKAFGEIESNFPKLKIPIRVIYGKNDRILPKVANTMQRVKSDFPSAEVTVLPNCGHFLQEDEPEKIGQLILDFMKSEMRK